MSSRAVIRTSCDRSGSSWLLSIRTFKRNVDSPMNWNESFKPRNRISKMPWSGETNITRKLRRRRESVRSLVGGKHRRWQRSKVGLCSSKVIRLLLTLAAENVAALEETYGWKIISATGSALTMTYKDSLQLYFTPSSFLSPSSSSSPPTTNKENSPISLTYIADTHEHQPKPLTTEKRFFLQIIRAQLQCLNQSSTSTPDLLGFVSRNWDVALTIAEEVRALTTQYITTTSILSDEVMNVQAVLLLPPIKTKLGVSFQVQARGGAEGEEEEGIKEGLEVAVRSDVRVVYGEGLKEGRMREWVDGRLKEEGGERGGWVRCVGRLEEKIKGRGKR